MAIAIQRRHIREGGRPQTPFLLVNAVGQRGMTLIDFMVGISIGLLVVVAAVGSLIMTRSAARTMSDSAGLEQQAALVMMQIGQQISQAGAINAYLAGTDPDAGISGAAAAASGGDGKINFDTRPIGVNQDYPTVSVFGVAGGAGPDTLTISYIAPNDGAPASNCIGNLSRPLSTGGAPRFVSKFFIKTTANSSELQCGDGINSAQPIADNVLDMRIRYLLMQGDGNVVYQNAAQVANWSNISGLQVCLEMASDVTQAPEQTLTTDCRGDGPVTRNDGRIHRIIRQLFYLRNT
jgi:type IV pilus assembly protein PilW